MNCKRAAKLIYVTVVALVGCAAPTFGQEKNEASAETKAPVSKPQKVDPAVATGRVLSGDKGIRLSSPQTMVMQFGLKISANDNMCSNLVATIPFPMDWPEQKLHVLDHSVPHQAQSTFRDQPAGARQLLLNMSSLAPNNVAELLVKVEVEKSFIEAPQDTSCFRIPKVLSKELKYYMGNSPYIDCELLAIKKVAKAIAAESPSTAWENVEKLHDWVRENIEYKNGALRHIKESLKDKTGDCEEMTGIFVALCRASGIPARCVWIPDHCYPEFYLEDDDGVGHWFPCQAAGDRQFGQMHEYRPILQKGDRFKVPEENGQQRYVASFFTCKQRAMGGRNILVEEVLDLGPLQAQLAALQQAQAQDNAPKTIDSIK
jgi:hypothetical protein